MKTEEEKEIVKKIELKHDLELCVSNAMLECIFTIKKHTEYLALKEKTLTQIFELLNLN